MAEIDSRIPALAFQHDTPMLSFSDIVRNRVALQNQQQQQRQAEANLDLTQTRTKQEQLDNQQKAAALQSQESYLKAYADADGDPDKLDAALRNAPMTPEHRVAANKSIEDLRLRKEKMTADQEKIQREHKEQFGQGIRSIRSLPENQRLPAWQALVDEASKSVDPVTKTPYITKGQVDRENVPDTDKLTAIEKVLRGSTAFNAANLAEQKAREDAVVKAEAASLKVAQRQARAIQAVESQEDWDAALASLGEDAKGLPARYSEASKKAAVARAVSPEKMLEIIDKREDNIRADRKDEVDRLYKESMARSNALRASKSGQVSPTESNRVRRGLEDDLDRFGKEEQPLWGLRSALETAIKDGTTYVKKSGEVVPMTTVVKDAADQAAKDTLIEEMRGRYESLGSDLKRVTQRKNEIGQELGMGVQHPTSEIHAKIDKDNKSIRSGMIEPGNIDLNNRPVIKNPDGTTSTVRTITAEFDGKTYLLPTAVDGKIVSNDDAIAHFKKTGEHMGVFKDEKSADEYDKQLHNEKGWNGAPGSAQAKWQQSAAPSAPPASSLKEGVATKFKNGQTWTLKGGKPTQLGQ